MLPPHVFAEVIQWLHLYDLDALLLTDAQCSFLAHAAASKIRVFDFSGFQFALLDNEIAIFEVYDDYGGPAVAHLEFDRTKDLIDFLQAALRNCVLGNLSIWNAGVSAAVNEVAHTIVVEGTLHLDAYAFASAPGLVDFVASFRSVKSVLVFELHEWSDSQIEELVKLFDHIGFGQPEIVRGGWSCSASFVSLSGQTPIKSASQAVASSLLHARIPRINFVLRAVISFLYGK